MPIAYTVDRARQRLFTVAQGSVTYPEVVAHLDKERDDNCLPLTELIDATQATAVLSAAEVRLIVDRLRNLGRDNALGQTAVVTGDDISYGMMRMLEILVQDVCNVRPFRDRGKAEEWLNAIPMRRPPAKKG
jgi:hypothetical protein